MTSHKLETWQECSLDQTASTSEPNWPDWPVHQVRRAKLAFRTSTSEPNLHELNARPVDQDKIGAKLAIKLGPN